MSRTRGGTFIVQETKSENIFTIFDLNEEQKMIRDTTKEFIDREVWPYKERFENKDYDFTFELMKKAGELGLLGITVPEEYGGMGMGFTSTMLVCDYFSGATGSLGTAYGAHTGIGTLPILLYGTETQIKTYVPKLATGEWISCYCLTEPGAGSDANSGKTKAVLSDDGKNYLITGQKMWISNAGYADLLIVYARINDDKNITAFIVPNDPENGITMNEEEHKLGIRASSTRQVFFNETKVPVENVLGEPGNGFKIALNALNVGRIKLGAACLDAGRRIMGLTINYANERVQFKVPISSFGAIQEKLAEMATNVFISESASYRAAYDIEQAIADQIEKGRNHQESELKGVEEYAVECAMVKVWVSDKAQETADMGIQIYGGMGFSEDTPMESFWRDSRIGRIYEGTNEINTLLTIDMMLRKAMKGHVDLLTPAKAVADELLSVPSFETPDYSELLAMEKEVLSNLKKLGLMVAGQAAQKYGTDLEQQQELVMNCGRILIEVYMAESGLLVAEKLAKQRGEEQAKEHLAMAKLNLFQASEKCKKFAAEIIPFLADGDEAKGMFMGLKRFTKYAEAPNPIAFRKTIAKKLIEENRYCFSD